jgi:hypothetical protein
LNAQVHRKQSTPKDWKFEVLTKMVVIQKYQIASEEWLVYARAFLAPDLQPATPLGPKRELLQKTKGVPKRIGKNRPTNEKAGADKNGLGSKPKHLWSIQSWGRTTIGALLTDLFKMNPHQHPRNRHSQRRITMMPAH